MRYKEKEITSELNEQTSTICIDFIWELADGVEEQKTYYEIRIFSPSVLNIPKAFKKLRTRRRGKKTSKPRTIIQRNENLCRDVVTVTVKKNFNIGDMGWKM